MHALLMGPHFTIVVFGYLLILLPTLDFGMKISHNSVIITSMIGKKLGVIIIKIIATPNKTEY